MRRFSLYFAAGLVVGLLLGAQYAGATRDETRQLPWPKKPPVPIMSVDAPVMSVDAQIPSDVACMSIAALADCRAGREFQGWDVWVRKYKDETTACTAAIMQVKESMDHAQ